MLAGYTTYLDVAQAALDYCKGQTISDLDDPRNPNAVLCKRHLGQCVQAELESREWSFATKWKVGLTELVKDPENPNPMKDFYVLQNYHCYELPTDFQKLSYYFFNDYYQYRFNQYQRGHNYFLSNDNKYIYLKAGLPTDFEFPYQSKNIPPEQFSALFMELMAVSLAFKIAPLVDGSDNNIEYFRALSKTARTEAIRANQLQREPQPTGLSDTQLARGGGFYGSI